VADPRLANIYTIENDPSNSNQLVNLLSPTGKWWATGKCLPGGTQGVHYIANPFDYAGSYDTTASPSIDDS
jgi:hypothetical protein